MKVEIINEVTAIEDGTYQAIVSDIFEYREDNVCMKLALLNDPDKRVFIKFYSAEELGARPWGNVFRSLDTSYTDDLISKTVEIEVVNNKSKATGKEFCNIKKVKLV
jgi:hypothetical protein